MKVRDLRGLLRRSGCLEVRQSGSHLIVRCGTCQTVVPIHSGDIPVGTLKSIVRDLTPCIGKDWLTNE
ncbi:MAG: type II toxin-antitoxin system HicA family toxin [Acidimicrobiales bacterium]|jgi:predicted RNA binding protein YcfA (HicA-like mRNA interferase family)